MNSVLECSHFVMQHHSLNQKQKKGSQSKTFFFHNSSFGMIGIVMKTISILCLHKMFLPLKMCNASEKCHLMPSI